MFELNSKTRSIRTSAADLTLDNRGLSSCIIRPPHAAFDSRDSAWPPRRTASRTPPRSSPVALPWIFEFDPWALKSLPFFVDFDALRAPLFGVTIADLEGGSPKGKPPESAAEVAHARSYEEPAPGSGAGPLRATQILNPELRSLDRRLP